MWYILQSYMLQYVVTTLSRAEYIVQPNMEIVYGMHRLGTKL